MKVKKTSFIKEAHITSCGHIVVIFCAIIRTNSLLNHVIFFRILVVSEVQQFFVFKKKIIIRIKFFTLLGGMEEDLVNIRMNDGEPLC